VADPIWCVAANVRPEAYGNASSVGTKHFKAGALIWVVTGYWGDGFSRIHVLGRHRVSNRFITIVQEAARLTNFRAKPAYHPAVIPFLRDHMPPLAWANQEECERAAKTLNTRFPPVPDLAGETARRKAALALLEDHERGRELDRMATAALGRWTQKQRQEDRMPPIEVFVLSDWLEDLGVPIAIDELVRTLDRRRVL